METNEILDYSSQDFNVEGDFEYADKWKRFFNFLIDRIAFYALALGVGAILGLYINLSSDPIITEQDLDSTTFNILDFIFSLLLYVGYYVVQEYYLQGKTIGKYITKTRAVRLDNSPMDLTSVIRRSFSRIVPFEPFSFFGSDASGWHDDWADTKVIVDKGWKN